MAASLAGWYSQRVEPVLVAQENLQRHEDDQQVERHADHHARFLGRPAAAQQPGADAQHDEGRRDVEGGDIVREAIGE